MKTILRTAIRWYAARKMAGASVAPVAAPLSSGTQRLRNGQLNAIFGLLAMLYTIWPIDLIPDLVPVLGWTDDALILGFTGYQLLKSLRPTLATVKAKAENVKR